MMSGPFEDRLRAWTDEIDKFGSELEVMLKRGGLELSDPDEELADASDELQVAVAKAQNGLSRIRDGAKVLRYNTFVIGSMLDG